MATFYMCTYLFLNFQKTYYKAERIRPKSLLNPFKRPTDEPDFKQDDDEDLRYFENPEDYNTPLEQAYAFASKTLLELLVKDRDLIGHLRSVKHYFLLDQGDFIGQYLLKLGAILKVQSWKSMKYMF